MSRPMRVLVSPLTGRAYATNDYTETASGGLVSRTKHDVTADVVCDLMAAAWARGWNECNAAAEGEAPLNPYRPTTPPTDAAEAAGGADHG